MAQMGSKTTLWKKGNIPWNKGLPKELQPAFEKQNALGFHHSDDAKKRIGAAHRGKIVSRETKDKMSLSAIEHGHSRIIDGKKGSREYHTWCGMRARCTNPKDHRYADYAGRGIKVCRRWLGKNGFINFLQDMGECPVGMTLDRKENDGNYEPSNCQWATKKQQIGNRRPNVTNHQYLKLQKVFLFTLICLELAMRRRGEKCPN